MAHSEAWEAELEPGETVFFEASKFKDAFQQSYTLLDDASPVLFVIAAAYFLDHQSGTTSIQISIALALLAYAIAIRLCTSYLVRSSHTGFAITSCGIRTFFPKHNELLRWDTEPELCLHNSGLRGPRLLPALLIATTDKGRRSERNLKLRLRDDCVTDVRDALTSTGQIL